MTYGYENIAFQAKTKLQAAQKSNPRFKKLDELYYFQTFNFINFQSVSGMEFHTKGFVRQHEQPYISCAVFEFLKQKRRSLKE